LFFTRLTIYDLNNLKAATASDGSGKNLISCLFPATSNCEGEPSLSIQSTVGGRAVARGGNTPREILFQLYQYVRYKTLNVWCTTPAYRPPSDP
jgi:hypothetical protein